MSEPASAPFYDRFWSERPAALSTHDGWRLAQVIAAITFLRERGARLESILELGCGGGWLAAELSRFGAVTAIDRSAVAIERARAAHPGITFEVADALAYRPAAPADLVVSCEVIEHVDDQAAFIATMRHCLAPGGHILITCPNGRVARHMIPRLESRQPIEAWPTPAQLRRLLGRDFEVLAHRTFVLDLPGDGIYRWLRSPRLAAFLTRLHLDGVYDAVRASLGLGLYQMLVARLGTRLPVGQEHTATRRD